jgi:hypothetical protein
MEVLIDNQQKRQADFSEEDKAGGTGRLKRLGMS